MREGQRRFKDLLVMPDVRLRYRQGACLLLFAVVALLGLLCLWMWRARIATDYGIRAATWEQFAAIGIGLVHYSEFHGHLPPISQFGPLRPATVTSPANTNGRMLYSWRVAIWPYLTSWHGVWDPEEAWDHPANRQLMELSGLYSYQGRAIRLREPNDAFADTNVLAITGPGTAFGDHVESPSGIEEIPQDTILAVETRASGIPWPAPGDFDIRTMPKTTNSPDGRGVSGRAVGGFHVLFADGQVWFLSERVPYATLRLFFVVSDAQRNDRERRLGPFVICRGR